MSLLGERQPGSSIAPRSRWATSPATVRGSDSDWWRTIVAWALGALGPVAHVWNNGDLNQRAGAWLALATLGLAVALRLAPWLRWAAVVIVPLPAVAAVLGPGDQIGRTPVVIALVLVITAHFALVAGLPIPGRTNRPYPTSLGAVALLVGAGIVWWTATAVAPTIALAGVAGAVILAAQLAPAVVERLERRPQAVLAGLLAILWRARVGTGLDDAALLLRRHTVSGAAWLRGPKSRRDRSLILAIVVAFALRMVWAVLMTRGRNQWYTEWNIRIAESFAHWTTPKFGGLDTAYWPPGHGATLAPVVWLSEHTGWFGVSFGASLVNVVFGTATVVFVAALAKEAVSPAARNPAAWIFALAPGQIYATSVAVGEPVATTLWAAFAWGAVVVVRRRTGTERHRLLFTLGIVLGYAALTKDISISLVVIPALLIRVGSGSWKGALRATVAVGLGAAVLLGPWALRNAVQVGWPSPFATISSEGLCATKYDQDIREYFENGAGIAALDPDLLADCYPGSIFDNPASGSPIPMPGGWKYGTPDEGAWARRNNLGYLKWAVTHPLHFIEVTPMRLHGIAGNDSHGGFEMAGQYDEPLVGPLAGEVLQDAQTAWYYAVAAMALLGLIKLRRLRRSPVLWYPLVVLWSYTILGPWSQSRHAFSVQPFLAVLAAGVVAALGALSARSSDDDDEAVAA